MQAFTVYQDEQQQYDILAIFKKKKKSNQNNQSCKNQNGEKKIPCLVMDLVLKIKHYMLDVIIVLLSFCQCVNSVEKRYIHVNR